MEPKRSLASTVAKSLSRKNSTPRRSPWNGPAMVVEPTPQTPQGTARSHRPSLRNAATPQQFGLYNPLPADEGSSDDEDHYGRTPLVPTRALLSNLGYAPTPVFATPSLYDQFLPAQYRPSPFMQTPYVGLPPQFGQTPAMSQMSQLYGTPPGFVPQSIEGTPIHAHIPMPMQSPWQPVMTPGDSLPMQSPWQPVMTPADHMMMAHPSPYIGQRGVY